MGRNDVHALLVVLMVLFCILPGQKSEAAGKKATPSAATAEDAQVECANLLKHGESMARYDYLSQSWSLDDLLTTDLSKNLAALYPTIIMNSDQLDWMVVNRYPRHKIKDPAYRRSSYWYYPLISAGVKETKHNQIIGHYETVERALNYISDRAHGKRASKMLGFVGPAGSGKTALGILLEIAKVSLANEDPDYYQFTFEFQNLKGIEGLEPLLYGAEEGGVSPAIEDIGLGRSPIVLLPPALQQRVVDFARATFREKTAAKNVKMDPLPFLTPTGKTQKVIDAIIAHYKVKEKKDSVTTNDYMRWLSPHVKIVRRTFDEVKPPAIVRYLGKHPDMQTLFFTENLGLSQFYGPNNPLSYTYGLIPGNDGKGLFIDEFFRQTPEVRDSFLDLAQNQTAQNGGAPAERLNTTIYFATNDDSIDEAKQNGGAKAHLSRTIRLPMRHAIEPWLAVKIALMDIGPHRFKMRKIKSLPDPLDGTAPERPDPAASAGAEMVVTKDDASKLEDYDPQVVIPDVESGELVGPDGHYALYYQANSDAEPILVAPRALWMIGLLASATRIVTEPGAFTKINTDGRNEFDTFQKYKQVFVDPKERLQVIIGTKQVENAVAEELQKARDLLREGQNGIGARNIEEWLSYSLQLAASRGGTLTPVIVDQAFSKLLDNEGIEATPAERSKYIQLMTMIKAEFILPALTTDVISLLQGHGRAERLYDDVKDELLTLSKTPDAEYIQGEGNHRIPIDKKRLSEIYNLFRKISNYDFDPGMLKDFHLQVSPRANPVNQRMPELMEAIRRYLARRELDKTTVSELYEYFNKKPVSESVRSMGSLAEAQLADHGYNRIAFMQALSFVRDRQFLIQSEDRRPKQP